MSPAAARLDGVAKIAVLRPNAVGDFVFALPALHALKHAYPDAELVFLGKAWHADFLEGRPGPVDRVVVMPPVPGVGAPVDRPADGSAVERFVERMRDERFDIVAQMYGGGRHSNPFTGRLGARLVIGARADGAPALERWVPHVEPGNRRLALLEIAALAGGTPPWLPRELELTPADRAAAAQELPPDPAAAQPGQPSKPSRPLVLLQPGSSDPRRCWPAGRFAALGDALAAAGALVAVNGTAQEAGLVRRIVDGMRHPALNLAGKLGLGGLCGVLERSALVVSNDTGPLHLALAIGTPAVGIFWHTNLVDGAPLRPGLLRAAVSAQVSCPVCGADNRASRCPHQESFVDDIPVDEVLGLALSQLRTQQHCVDHQ
ncbi:glycosyltransferase family 9 protein [Massilia sp. LjRoot122]|uniref:glycosyltransferase family 9 protein n=1 Tax=Massilia sp. LjRoot122 TaxID=3342257 RepID=UPI003ECFB769